MEYTPEEIEKAIKLVNRKKQADKKWYEKNKDRVVEAGKKWRKENREKYIAQRKARYQKNIEKMREKARIRYQEVGRFKRLNNPERKKKEAEWAVTRIAKLKEFIKKTKINMGGRCEKCGYDKELRILHFHHINGGKDKLGNISEMKSQKKILEESKKCILLCSNCHALEHLSL